MHRPGVCCLGLWSNSFYRAHHNLPVSHKQEVGQQVPGTAFVVMNEGVHVSPPEEGYLCNLVVTVRLPTEPDTAYRILTDPDNARMFRNIEDCPYRKILVNDKKTNRQRVEVEHAAGWRFLMFHGQFKTRLIVEQDGIARIMTFTLKPGSGGLMRQFEGTWYVKPDLDSAGKGPSCVATLRQKIMPLIHGPGLDWIVTGICKRQLGNLVEDLKQEVKRINEGKPIPSQQQKKPARNWRAAELQGFALEFSDSDDDAEDGGEEHPQVSKAAPQKSAAEDWPLLAAAVQADRSAAGTDDPDAEDAAGTNDPETDESLAEALKEAAKLHGPHPDVSQLLDNEWHHGSSPPKT